MAFNVFHPLTYEVGSLSPFLSGVTPCHACSSSYSSSSSSSSFLKSQSNSASVHPSPFNPPPSLLRGQSTLTPSRTPRSAAPSSSRSQSASLPAPRAPHRTPCALRPAPRAPRPAPPAPTARGARGRFGQTPRQLFIAPHPRRARNAVPRPLPSPDDEGEAGGLGAAAPASRRAAPTPDAPEAGPHGRPRAARQSPSRPTAGAPSGLPSGGGGLRVGVEEATGGMARSLARAAQAREARQAAP